MHMADALVSPIVAGTMGIISGTLVVIAAKKIRKSQTENIVPLMGVMGAFIFAAQMINFTIPGTGSSGHIVGGILLAALLGPCPALITLASVLIIQCLIFADGGLMALGCNIFNMAVCACLIAYPLVFKPLMKYPASLSKIIWVSVFTCVISLELGALAVTIETEASGITALPISQFLMFMTPIHLAIGIGEGLATAVVLYFVQKYKPELLMQVRQSEPAESSKTRFGKAILVFAILALIIGGTFSWTASSNPDGLEWSVFNVTGQTEPPVSIQSKVYDIAQSIQGKTAVIPDYDTTFAGIIGGIIVVLIIWVLSSLLQYKKKILPKHNE
ncbi:energy-coupling factor ABC transporter permease [Bacteroides sp.]|uniref:energy-coupling factor ABC transporter permease n=1 Tax=Bacteroides sp. TaxID=29523 RepID=UPI00262D119A|nr:energy-coupling factor ABC transporter permease [Bacteroides sp.]MDD3037563.1 energy-coupling factor ABC transporter permease [Bacteroides sp.]